MTLYASGTMFIVERLIAVVAPHICLGCGQEGRLVCAGCATELQDTLPPRCFACKRFNKDSSVCDRCRVEYRLRHVWVATEYQGLAKSLVHKIKFERAKAGAQVAAEAIAEALPYLPKDTLVTHIPTATSRRRERGYDQAELIARHLARQLGFAHETLLTRLGQSRQVGAKREQRRAQLADAFQILRPLRDPKRPVLLIDDIATTGATLAAAAKALRRAGYKTITGAVFAQR